MELEHEFTVPVPVLQAWDVLLDVERIAPCMPGATVEAFDGETIEGRVKVKVGPIQVTYAGTARFVEKDEAARRAVIDARAKEARGSGTANATITAVLHESGTDTKVTVTTDLAITGRPAQFGRGVMAEVGNKLLGRFADCLAGELTAGGAEASAAAATAASSASGAESTTAASAAAADRAAAGSQAASEQAATAATAWESADPAAAAPPRQAAGPRAVPSQSPSRAAHPVSESEPIDLLDTAGLPVLKRLAPLVLGALLLVVVWRSVARRR
jgi:carbon monoxide dehydrogenase subunit G